jgi:hypothetical protein
MSLIKILLRPITGKKEPLIFVGNGNAQLDEIWHSLTKEGTSPSLDIEFSEKNLYDALRGYLDKQGVQYKQQGEHSPKILLRLEEPKDIAILKQFCTNVKTYKAIESKIHSEEDDKKLIAFKDELAEYASRYS